ncbi:MAG TPA: radical SAM protein [Methanosarcina sp.]|jgi:radical SAM protein with 4Fe4S-binding SPASM domain|nr:radical SAM protein [Methanosarcina sp.]
MELLSKESEITSFFGTIPIMAASIRLTKRCNLKCVHCYADSKYGIKGDYELKTDEITSIIDQLADLSVNEIFFTGGEPLMRQDLADILRYTSRKGIRVLMSTNGIALTESFLEKVKDVDFKLFQISLDGPKKVHEQIRGPGSFERAISAVKLASMYLKKNVCVGTVLSNINAQCIDKTMELAYGAGADTFALMFLILSGRASEKISPSAIQIKSALDNTFATYRRLSPNIRFAHNTTIPPALYPPDLVNAGIHTKCALCSFPYTIGIEANGDVAPCDGFFGPYNFVAGNIRKQSLKEMWNCSQQFHIVRETEPQKLTGVCKLCRYQDFCGGGCRASAYINMNDITSPDPVCDRLYQANLFPISSLRDMNDSL